MVSEDSEDKGSLETHWVSLHYSLVLRNFSLVKDGMRRLRVMRIVFCTQTLEVHTWVHVYNNHQGIPTSAFEAGRTPVRWAQTSCTLLLTWDRDIS